MSEKYPLKTERPERLGIPSKSIIRFIERLEAKKLCMHSVLMLRHGKIAVEAYWKPFNADLKHRMYSSSKSFVSVAIGILIGEGGLSLDTRIADIFPEYKNANLQPYTAMTKVWDLLTMTTPFPDAEYAQYDDWTEAFFKKQSSHMPGKSFKYDTLATVMLCMIIRRISGVELMEYLREHLFQHLGMSEDTWCIQTPCGHDWGGSGILCTSRDFAKFALVCMNKGRYNGMQLIPEDYITDATSCIVDTSISVSEPEQQYGYGYQFWRMRHGFACCGMGNQLAVCIPDADFILVTTADTQAVIGEHSCVLDAFWDEIYPHITRDAPLPENECAYRQLCDYTSELSLLTVKGEMTSPMAAEVSGKLYTLTENKMNIKNIRFTFEGDEGLMAYENATGYHELRFGFGRQLAQEFPESHYYGKQFKTPLGRGYACNTSAAWKLVNSLVLYCYITDWYLGTLKMNFVFDENTITIQSEKSAEEFLDEYQGFASGVCD